MMNFDSDTHNHARQSFAPDEWTQYLHTLWSDKIVAIWGAARSGIAAAQLLSNLGAQVILSDHRSNITLPPFNTNVTVHLGSANLYQDVDVVIPSPGIPPNHDLFKAIQAEQIPVMSEIELGALCTQAQLIAITGTDGKSTCTSLMNHVLDGLGYQTQAVGNIGDPISNWSLCMTKDDYLVVEVSAFQLWSTHYFPARLAMLTNIAEDHYDYFGGDAIGYRQAKLRLAHLLPAQSYFLWPDLLNDSWVSEMMVQLKAQHVHCVTYGQKKESHYYVSNHGYYKNKDELSQESEVLAPLHCSQLIGRHHQRNVLAVLAALELLTLNTTKALDSIASFQSLPHRMAQVRIHEGVVWINDSKATNAHASLAGLRSVDHPLHVICGGYDKSLDLSEWIEWLAEHAQQIYLIGDLSLQISTQLSKICEENKYHTCGTLDQAVHRASQNACAGDMVILSPASSSFDQFKSFEHRGDVFERLVHAL